MISKHKLFVTTGMFVITGALGLAQEPPAPPAPPARPARPAIAPVPPRAWTLDTPETPVAPARAWHVQPGLVPPAAVWTPEAPMPPEPPEPPAAWELMTPLAPLPPMMAFAPMPALPTSLGEWGLLAFQDAPRAERDRAREMAREQRVQQDRDERNYRSGKSYLDRKEYEKAIDYLNKVIENKGNRTDGAYYWRAYALNRMGKRDEALASLAELQKNYAGSHWLEDAKALQAEINTQRGQPPSPESTTDEDLKLLVLSGMGNGDPERVVPIVEKLLKSTNSPRLKERALFVLAQSHSQKSREVLAEVAKGGSNPDLQSKAIEYLGVYGGRDNMQILVDVYKSTNDFTVKRAILNSFMVSGGKDNLLAVARSESNSELKVLAIQLLGSAGGSADLAQLYTPDAPIEIKRAVIQGLFVAGNSEKLIELAKSEKDAGVRHLAINQLGVMGRTKTGPTLAGLYSSETDLDNKKAIVNALFIQGNASALVEIARKESDLNLKKTIINQLSIMHSKEATDYLMEILTK
jgi:HEAT repeat protein